MPHALLRCTFACAAACLACWAAGTMQCNGAAQHAVQLTIVTRNPKRTNAQASGLCGAPQHAADDRLDKLRKLELPVPVLPATGSEPA